MGSVWRALKLAGDTGWSRQVALKVILPGYADLEAFSRLFANEARIAAGLNHANIVPVSDFGNVGGVLYLEQELVDGTDLARLLHRCPGGIAPPLATYIILEALKGLAHAHDHTLPDGRREAVIHRDIKPGNILVAREGHVKLTDFGVAKRADQSTPSVTQLRGTLGYLSPELLEGKQPSTRSDLFAMGLVLWDLLTGRRLFDGDNDAVKLLKTYECQVPWLAEVGVSVPPALEAVLRKLLARDPAVRYGSADEAVRDLLALGAGRAATSVDLKALLSSIGIESLPRIDPSLATPLKATSAVLGEVRPPRKSSRLVGGAALAALALAGGALVAVLASRHEPAPVAAAVVVPDAAPVVDAMPRVVDVRVEVEPADASLALDGKTLMGPPYIVSAPPGARLTLRAHREGHEPLEQAVDVPARATVVRLTLTASPPPPPSEPEIIETSETAAPPPVRTPHRPRPRPQPRTPKAPAPRGDGVFLPEEN